MIKEFAPQFSPDTVSLDFEEAVINAFIAAFPNVQINGCYFHLMQNFKDKLGKRHLNQVEFKNLTLIRKLNWNFSNITQMLILLN